MTKATTMSRRFYVDKVGTTHEVHFYKTKFKISRVDLIWAIVYVMVADIIFGIYCWSKLGA